MSSDYGHITLDSSAFVLDLSQYKGRDIIDFAPRAATPGGGQVMSQLGFYQPILFTNWQAGFGYPWHTDANGYLRTDGEIDARHFGMVMRMTTPQKQDTSAYTSERIDGFMPFKGDVYAWGNGGVYKIVPAVDDTSWSRVSDTVAVNAMWHNGYRIFSAKDGRQIEYADSAASDSGDWTKTGVNDSAADYQHIYHHDGYVYAVKDLDDSGQKGNQVYYSSSVLLSDLQGNPTDDPNVIYVGLEGYQVGRPQTYQGDLLFPRPDGLYRMDKDRQTARRWLDYFDQSDTDNFRSMAVWNGFLVYPIKDKIFRWNGTAETDITPPRLTDKFPYTTYGRFTHLTTIGQRLYLIGRTNESTYQEHLLVYDGAGWHKLLDLVTNGTGEVTAMNYDPNNNRIWYFIHDGANSSTYRIPFQNQSDFPDATFKTSGTHSIISSRIDAGFRMVTKSTPSIWVGGQNLSDSSYISIFYALDDSGAWRAWGGTDGTTNVVQTSGMTELINPDSGATGAVANSTLEYNHIKIRADLVTTDSTQSPILEDLVLRVMMRPSTLYGFTLPIILSDKVKYGLMEGSERPHTILQRIKDIRNSASPVNFVDPYGDSYRGYISSVNFQLTEQHAKGEMGPQDDIEGRAWVTFVQV